MVRGNYSDIQYCVNEAGCVQLQSTAVAFHAGVRVLLQVAVVLVRRVLGRADQRKMYEGQMETLERLRGVREHVQEEADAFIAEVRIKNKFVVENSQSYWTVTILVN